MAPLGQALLSQRLKFWGKGNTGAGSNWGVVLGGEREGFAGVLSFLPVYRLLGMACSALSPVLGLPPTSCTG